MLLKEQGVAMTAAADPVRETRSYLRRLLAAARRGVDREAVEASVYDNGGLSGRYLMMTVISAAIAALGLMLSSPAVVIGAMLVSPMMGPIVALGFSLALLDWRRLKQSLTCLAVGMAVALTVAILLTLLSPLKEPTSEILARTRPNFFDLLIAVFSGVAGAYAVIRQRGETIIGVAIATALMPPVATVGFGIGTGDLSIPLVISLRAIGLESQATAETRTAVADIFAGADSRVTLLDARSEGQGVTVSTLVSTRKLVPDAQKQLQDRLSAALHVPVTATLDQIVVADPHAASRAVQASAGSSPDPTATLRTRLSDAVPFATDAVMVDAEGRRAIVLLRPDAGLDLASAYALEAGLRGRFEGVDVWVTPPVQELSVVDLGDAGARARAVWALTRWRASPAVRDCRPAPGAAVAEDQEPSPNAGEAFRAQLTAAGVAIPAEPGPECRRGDQNLARLSLG